MTRKQDEKEAVESSQAQSAETLDAEEIPTSSDVGKQTLTKADLGYDVTKEGTPPDDVALASPQHPDDPSAKTESDYNK